MAENRCWVLLHAADTEPLSVYFFLLVLLLFLHLTHAQARLDATTHARTAGRARACEHACFSHRGPLGEGTADPSDLTDLLSSL